MTLSEAADGRRNMFQLDGNLDSIDIYHHHTSIILQRS